MSKRRFIEDLAVRVVIILFAMALWLVVDFIRFPECYISTWRYQLIEDVKEGDELATEYYNRVYVANGRELIEGWTE